ncbi:hypothetical protein L2E82_40138 [Cichorium intybus]|uniref:Uncharacterized protein n=1 Tax=Cichorium intybus TaxID=13427 RepID=A0ACB9AK85_CICIN|nr:hypothetical protein L2E82_40138 [Cichorium intybus]
MGFSKGQNLSLIQDLISEFQHLAMKPPFCRNQTDNNGDGTLSFSEFSELINAFGQQEKRNFLIAEGGVVVQGEDHNFKVNCNPPSFTILEQRKVEMFSF